MNQEEADQAASMLVRQIIDQVLMFVVLLLAWFLRGYLHAWWAQGCVLVLVLIIGADYVLHNPKLSAKRRARAKLKK